MVPGGTSTTTGESSLGIGNRLLFLVVPLAHI